MTLQMAAKLKQGCPLSAFNTERLYENLKTFL